MRWALLTAALAVVGVGVVGSLAGKAKQDADPKCLAPDEWFKDNKTPPADSAAQRIVECDFYKWGWQSFLWLTQSEDGDGSSPRFVNFKTPNDLFQGPEKTPLQLLASPLIKKDNKKILSLAVRTMRMDSKGKGQVSAVAIEQAGSQGVVVDRNNRAIYFGIHLNDRFVTFINKDLGLTNPDKIKDVPLTKQFPAGCLELKSSWRILTEDERKPEQRAALDKTFFITEALVPRLFTDPSDQRIKADPTKPRKETVALVGLHVVGIIEGHSEFIWASFEHVKNSPILADPTLPGNKPVDGVNDYTFYRKGTNRIDCNVSPVEKGTLKLTSADNQTLSPVVDVFRQFNSGDDGVSEDKDVASLNADVQSKLNGTLSKWKNYKLIGAVWLDKPADTFKENKRFDNDNELAGEKRLSNSTMETFTQASKVNCFRCHDTHPENQNGKDLPGLRIKISHVIRNAYIGPSK
jgi:hypothetical protein